MRSPATRRRARCSAGHPLCGGERLHVGTSSAAPALARLHVRRGESDAARLEYQKLRDLARAARQSPGRGRLHDGSPCDGAPVSYPPPPMPSGESGRSDHRLFRPLANDSFRSAPRTFARPPRSTARCPCSPQARPRRIAGGGPALSGSFSGQRRDDRLELRGAPRGPAGCSAARGSPARAPSAPRSTVTDERRRTVTRSRASRPGHRIGRNARRSAPPPPRARGRSACHGSPSLSDLPRDRSAMPEVEELHPRRAALRPPAA